jgi:hypothetical protein
MLAAGLSLLFSSILLILGEIEPDPLVARRLLYSDWWLVDCAAMRSELNRGWRRSRGVAWRLMPSSHHRSIYPQIASKKFHCHAIPVYRY